MDKNFYKRKERLMVQARRNQILKKLSKFAYVTEDSFLEVRETTKLIDKLYHKIDSFKKYEQVSKQLSENLNKIKSLQSKFVKFQNMQGVILYKNCRKYGAIKICVKDFFYNLNSFSDFLEFSEGKGDLMLIEKNLNFGIYLERYEYLNKLFYWL